MGGNQVILDVIKKNWGKFTQSFLPIFLRKALKLKEEGTFQPEDTFPEGQLIKMGKKAIQAKKRTYTI